MPISTVIPWRKRVLTETISSSGGALRLIGLVLALGSLSPLMVIPWQSTTQIFSWIAVPMIANIGYIAFTERQLLNQMSKGQWIHWVATMSLGVISIDFAGIFAHTATIFIQDPSTALFWDHVSLALFGGSFSLSVFQSYTKRFIGRQVKDRTSVILVIVFVVLIATLWWIEYFQNPHDLLRLLIANLLN